MVQRSGIDTIKYHTKVHNILPRLYYDKGAYCVGKVHNMLPQEYYDIWRILCR